MAHVQCKITPLSVYLMALATYSTLMMLACLQNELDDVNKEGTQNAPLKDDGELMNRRYERSLHGKSWLRNVNDFYARVGTLETTCSKMVSIGGTYCRGAEDNNKILCLDEDVRLLPNNCTVYSFGIGADTSFDDQINNYGCDVFMFDPTVNQTVITSTNLKKERFYLLGLDVNRFTRHHMITYPHDGHTENITGEYDTYDSIRRRLGHENRTIHYLKMDIENTEWRVLPYLVQGGRLEGVRQLAIEIHTMNIINTPNDKVIFMLHQYWRILEQLTRLGFLRAWYRPNVVLESLYHVPDQNKTIPTCFEVLYLRRGPVY